MNVVHATDSANRHPQKQVPIDRWQQVPIGALNHGMMTIARNAFRDALVWHMDRTGVTIADLARATGVTEDTIKKMRSRSVASTSVANAVLIANYFGFSVERFMRMETESETRLRDLSDLLLPEEERMIEAQVRGLLRARGL